MSEPITEAELEEWDRGGLPCCDCDVGGSVADEARVVAEIRRLRERVNESETQRAECLMEIDRLRVHNESGGRVMRKLDEALHALVNALGDVEWTSGPFEPLESALAQARAVLGEEEK